MLCVEEPSSLKSIITLYITSRDWSFNAALMELTQILHQWMQQFPFALHIGTQTEKQDFN